MRFEPVLALLLAPSLAAQAFWIDYPTELETTKHSNNVIPLGSSGAKGPFDDTRWQQLLPARCLPALRCRLEAMSVMSMVNPVGQSYALLKIDIAATREEALQPDLDGNLRGPMTVLELHDQTVQWAGHAATRIAFRSSYPYDGTSSLVFDIQKILGNIGSNVNMKTSPQNAPGVPNTLAVFGQDWRELEGPVPRTINLALIMRLHFVARETLGARLVPSGRRLGLEAGVVGIGGEWRVLTIAHRASAQLVPAPCRLPWYASDQAPANLSLRVAPGGLGQARTELPNVRELVGTTIALQVSAGQMEPRWEKELTVRIVL
jgi:hypothetical protein